MYNTSYEKCDKCYFVFPGINNYNIIFDYKIISEILKLIYN